MPEFRLATSKLLLTYAQCPLSKEDVLDHLRNLLAPYTPHLRVAREQHQDGHYHLHVYVSLERKLFKRGNGAERYFDISRDPHNYHPNIESRIRSPSSTLDYVSKDGDYIDFGSPEETISPTKTTQKELWAAPLQASTPEEFDSLVIEASPRDFIIFNDKIESFKQKKFKPVEPLFEPLQNFDISAYPTLQSFADQLTDVSYFFFFFFLLGGRPPDDPPSNPPSPPQAGGAIQA